LLDFIEKIKNTLIDRPVIAVADMLLFAALLYVTFAFLKKNNAERLILIVIPFVLLGAVFSSEALAFPIMGRLLAFAALFAALAIVVLFPAETRRALRKLSSPRDSWETFNTKYEVPDEELSSAIDHIVRSTQNMAKKNTGALLIIAPESLPAHILESGTAIDGKVSNSLLETIFYTKSPLHDGAVIIRGNRAVAAGCFLPLSQSLAIDKELGTRHRAAIGISEAYRVFAIIVSEETGVISVADNGVLTRYYDSEMLTDALQQVYGLKTVLAPKRKRKLQ